MTITRFVPFRNTINDVAVLQNRLNSIFHDFTRSEGSDQSESLASGNFIPPVDIFEDAQGIELKLEIPGIREEDLDIRIENQVLMVRGERKFEAEKKEENYHRIERRFGSFVRSFTLPQSVDTDAVQATCEAGVLTLKIAKKAEAKPRQVKIEVGSQRAAKQVEATPEAKQVNASSVQGEPAHA